MNYNKIINKFKKNSKGLSPVVASIILIAVTVAVSVVVAAWMGGTTIGLMGSAEQTSLTNIQFLPGTPDQIVVLVQNAGSNPVQISNAFINGGTATITNSTTQISKISSASFVLNLPTGITLSAGSSYNVKLVTAKGTSIVNTATYSP